MHLIMEQQQHKKNKLKLSNYLLHREWFSSVEAKDEKGERGV